MSGMDEGAVDPELLLRPGRGALIVGELLASSAHVPVAIAIAILLTREIQEWPSLLPALAGGFIQAAVLGNLAFRGRPPSFMGNLIGAALYTLGQAAADPHSVPGDPLILAYWAISIAVGVSQWLSVRLPRAAAEVVVIGEHIARALIIPFVYMVIAHLPPGRFLGQPEHGFLLATVVLFGIALGTAAVMRRRDQVRIGRIAGRLQEYSEMLLGRSRLHRAVGREDSLAPQRTRRSVVFADIRGFTSWSESRSPEEVLALLGALYEATEIACAPFHPVRTKHTADEVMMYFAEPLAAASAALALRDAAGAILVPHQLHVGVGIHHGDVIEGLVGASRTKAYDILGDTVNTAKRICDNARSGQVVITFTFFEACRGGIVVDGDRQMNAKGKSSTLLVAELLSVRGADQG